MTNNDQGAEKRVAILIEEATTTRLMFRVTVNDKTAMTVEVRMANDPDERERERVRDIINNLSKEESDSMDGYSSYL